MCYKAVICLVKSLHPTQSLVAALTHAKHFSYFRAFFGRFFFASYESQCLCEPCVCVCECLLAAVVHCKWRV